MVEVFIYDAQELTYNQLLEGLFEPSSAGKNNRGTISPYILNSESNLSYHIKGDVISELINNAFDKNIIKGERYKFYFIMSNSYHFKDIDLNHIPKHLLKNRKCFVSDANRAGISSGQEKIKYFVENPVSILSKKDDYGWHCLWGCDSLTEISTKKEIAKWINKIE